MSSVVAPDGTRLAYVEVGTGPRLVCVPGGPGRASAYLEDLGGLSEERTLVRLDTRATGHSEVPADPSSLRFDRLAADVEALRVHLDKDRIDLLGHSAGCLVAQAWAAAHPDRVRSLVLVTPTDRLQGGRRSDVGAIRETRSEEPWYAEAAEAQAALADAPPAQQQSLVRATRPFFYGRWDERTQAHAATADRQSSKRAELGFGAGMEAVDLAGMQESLAALDVPVLVVGGERDALTGVASVDLVAGSFARAQTAVLARAGHFPWVDEPEQFRAVVSAFLATV
ncbi:MAG: alpha/beta hydrolase [Frankiales bacterium]|nr:alpha/beta hydrolase [Frankiales bacterium]